MMASFAHSSRKASVAVLLAPQIVPIVDLFRAFGDFESHADGEALGELEDRLARVMTLEAAKGIVSDALLLAFGLTRERRLPLRYGPFGSRRGTMDELRLVALIAATFAKDFVLASEAAALLGLGHAQPLISLASDIAQRLEEAGFRLDMPDLRVFESDRPVVEESISPRQGMARR